MDVITHLRHVEVEPGVRLAVSAPDDAGSAGAPTVVFSNSLAADMGMWDEVAALVSPHARLVRYDTRGHGRSDAPDGPYSLAVLAADLAAVMDALDIRCAVICGLSLGGFTGMRLAIDAPERVAGLVLANTAASFPPAAMWHDRARAARADGLAPLVAPTLERWFTPQFRSARPERVAQIGATIGAVSGEGYASCCEVLAAEDILAELGGIACPTRVLVGRHDPSTPPARGEEIAAAIPGADLVALDGAHLSAVEAGAAFADAVLGLLRRATPDRTSNKT
ncbi:3-oxoadipate enol-lactonase [Xanthobacter tagetidis]|uniref:3-oxoadipate enol-lactonase n=1 Tax=Xanthobacter tagetidis TaxID=60216 RepID=A0A3L7AJ59_9HYPH|nr:3-oxoadipate enol-lactonase [Xanthobacter tagetidis]MBB6309070.1 3-oxoadipate enol-lactonase [Xanthobacter tagetidis]RLP80439.1 3-oxoadipate enol-lactonase [Xanthobacter tagetidis]